MSQKVDLFICFLLILLVSTVLSQDGNNKSSGGQLSEFSFEDAAVTLPSPADVQLDPSGRFYDRYKGNIKYLDYQHEHYGKFMVEVFASRQYSPGKLLERMWDGEYAGKWLDAATRIAVNTGKEDQLAMVDAFAASWLKYQQADGYMGVELPTDRELNDWEKNWDLWNQWTSMIGFLTHYEFRGIRASLEAASRIGSWIVKANGPIKDKNSSFFVLTKVVNIGQLVRLYRHTGNEELLEFVGQVIQYYPPIQQMLSTGEPFLAHPYMLSAVLGGVLEYATVTKDKQMLATVEKVWDGLVNTHLFPTGSLGESEDLYEGPLKDVPGGQLQETCATTEWIFFTQNLYAITGRAKYIEALELTTYNALLGAQSDDGMKWCYWTPMRYSKDWFHGPTRCCFWSGPRGIARVPQLIYATLGNIIYVNFFESSHGKLNTDNGIVKVIQNSEFPVNGKSTITIETPFGWTGALRVRVPGWATDIQLKLDGRLGPIEGMANGYRDIKLEGSNKYEIEIMFAVSLILEQLAGNDYAIRRGPEVLAIDMRDNIDTWLGQDDLISIPKGISLQATDSFEGYQWPGPSIKDDSRRRYRVKVEDRRTSEPRSVILTPYADAGNEGAAFRTIFPLESEDH
jgi:DUF1680 family protein